MMKTCFASVAGIPILGGIKLQVRESEAQDARAILHHTAPLDNP
jgi:hypothetical protein